MKAPLAPGALFSFSCGRARPHCLRYMLGRRRSFLRGGEITLRQDLLLAMLTHPAEALAQLLREKSRLHEGDEVVAPL